MVIVWIENFGQFFRVVPCCSARRKSPSLNLVRSNGAHASPATDAAAAPRHYDSRHGEIPRLTGNGKLRLPASIFLTLPPIPTCTSSASLWRNHGSYRDASHPALQPVCHRQKTGEQTILIVQTVTRRRLTDSCLESRKHAARRPRPPFPSAGSSLLPTGQSG